MLRLTQRTLPATDKGLVLPSQIVDGGVGVVVVGVGVVVVVVGEGVVVVRTTPESSA